MIVEGNSHNSKSLFKVMDVLLDRDKQSTLPAFDSPEQLATVFSDFLSGRIETVRSSLWKTAGPESLSEDAVHACGLHAESLAL